MNHAPRQSHSIRPGMIFVTALWVMLILSVMALIFARSMRVEVVTSGNDYSQAQASAVELGAEQWVLSQVDNTTGNALAITQNPQHTPEAMPVGSGYFWIITPDPDNPQNYLYGITDEASKLNLNNATETQLLLLPNATYEMADSIIDWIDADSNTTGQGAESDYYQSLPRPYNAKNAPIETPEELLLIKGIDETLLWGMDANRNGVIEPTEGSPQVDSNGVDTSRGIFPYITVFTIDSNLDSTGKARVDINTALQSSATTGGRGGPGAAPTPTRTGGGGARTGAGGTGGAPSRADPKQAAPAGGGPSAAGSTATTPGGNSAASGGGNSSQQLLQALQSGGMSSQRAQQIVTAAGRQQFTSVFDFAAKTGMKSDELTPVLDKLTTATGSTITGLVNINTASKAVLIALGLQPDDAQTLISTRQGLQGTMANTPDTSTSTDPSNMGWVTSALPASKLAPIGSKITGRSYIYSADIVAVSGDGRAFKRVRIVVNARNTPAKIVYQKDLTYLGWPLDPTIRQSLRAGQGLPAGMGNSNTTLGATH